ncbi:MULTISPECIES: alpha-E domain-containing protein [unclassified Verrucomicrobium]|uniref:alpha-E domain-containing protein n=1 Tax=unclassified Verrucomicrobium TaxID=2625155 RepID=UPI000678A92A|nr:MULTISPECIES: alpha-E domain-containing protein [unclassified Verrucomicrobium]
MSLPLSQLPVTAHRGSEIMLSRVANSLYWMSRYIERAENISRLLDVNLQLMLDFSHLDDEQLKEHWLPILRSAGDEETFFKHYTVANSRTVTEFMTFREENPNSVISCLFAARENARQIRDQISLEMFEALNECYLFLKSKNAREIWDSGAHEFYDQIKKYSHLFQGLTNSTFSRNEGYEFIQFGKFLERADKTTRILDIKYHILLPSVSDVGGAVDAAQWQAVLRSASALEAYRRFHMSDILPKKVAEFLIFSPSFPRSIRYSLERLYQYLHLLTETENGVCNTPEEEAFEKLIGDMRTLSIDDVFNLGLHEFLGNIQRTIDHLDDFIYQEFMYHPPTDMEAEIRLHQQEMQQQQQPAA